MPRRSLDLQNHNFCSSPTTNKTARATARCIPAIFFPQERSALGGLDSFLCTDHLSPRVHLRHQPGHAVTLWGDAGGCFWQRLIVAMGDPQGLKVFGKWWSLMDHSIWGFPIAMYDYWRISSFGKHVLYISAMDINCITIRLDTPWYTWGRLRIEGAWIHRSKQLCCLGGYSWLNCKCPT